MKKVLFNLCALCLLVATGVNFTSCSDDDPSGQKVEVELSVSSLDPALSTADLAGMKVVFTEVRNQEETEGVLDANGVARVMLLKSTYDISIEENVEGSQGEYVAAMRIENLSINADNQKVVGKVHYMPKSALGQNFIFSEIFFNGETNSGRMMHPDQYIVVFNPTVGTLYADGLCIAVTQQAASADKSMWYDEFYSKNKVPVGGFITVPGEGKDYPVGPGERFVIAFTAADHSAVEGYDHAVDLRGADFEIYYGPESNDIDNPAVPNVLLTENVDEEKRLYGFFFQPRGYVAPLMFKLENGKQETIDEFLKANTFRSKHLIPADEEKGTPEAIVEIDLYTVETASIIDGVQTSDQRQKIKTRTVPETVDRGKFLVSGCHRQELAIRKVVKVDNQTFYQDTNNSDDDFVMQKGQNSYPKGWRNQK